jgi:hypothetical protein
VFDDAALTDMVVAVQAQDDCHATPQSLEMLPHSTTDVIDSLSNHSNVVDWINHILDVESTTAGNDTSTASGLPTDLADLDQRVTW